MRVFLLCNLTGEWKVHAEVLAYNRATHMIRVRVKSGVEYERVFDPNSKYNRSDYKIVHYEEGTNAKLPELRA